VVRVFDRGVNASILVIEDNRADFILLQRAVRRAALPADLRHAESAEEGLSLLRTSDANGVPAYRPDLILLDLNLPHMSGHDFLALVKRDEAYCSIPIFILTSSTAEVDIERGYANHANGYIAKPVDFGQYDHIVDALFHSWFGLMQMPSHLFPRQHASAKSGLAFAVSNTRGISQL